MQGELKTPPKDIITKHILVFDDLRTFPDSPYLTFDHVGTYDAAIEKFHEFHYDALWLDYDVHGTDKHHPTTEKFCRYLQEQALNGKKMPDVLTITDNPDWAAKMVGLLDPIDVTISSKGYLWNTAQGYGTGFDSEEEFLEAAQEARASAKRENSR